MGYTYEEEKAFKSSNSMSKMKVNEVLELPILAIPERNITQKTAEHFQAGEFICE